MANEAQALDPVSVKLATSLARERHRQGLPLGDEGLLIVAEQRPALRDGAVPSNNQPSWLPRAEIVRRVQPDADVSRILSAPPTDHAWVVVRSVANDGQVTVHVGTVSFVG